MNLDGFQPHQSHSIGVPVSTGLFSFKQLNGSRSRTEQNQKQPLRKRSLKLSAKRNSRLYNRRNRIAWSTVYHATKHKTQIDHLEKFYQLKNRSEVINFIQENPSLLQLLNDAYCKIQHYFGVGVKVVLEVFTDYEVPTHRELMALVQTTLPVNDALDRLDRLYQEWWAEASAIDPLKMSVDVESI